MNVTCLLLLLLLLFLTKSVELMLFLESFVIGHIYPNILCGSNSQRMHKTGINTFPQHT